MGDFIDIYCERLEPGFWAEPMNAITNLSFIFAAFAGFMLARQEKAQGWRIYTLLGLLLCIGAGSFAFHTLATGAAQLADVIPIFLYQLVFLGFYSAHVMKVPAKATQSLIFLFLLLTVASRQIPEDVLNGSIQYLPALLILTRFAVWHWQNAKREKHLLAAAVGTFIVSLTFRTLDMDLCEKFPDGLHFMWHLLNGAVLYMTFRAYVLNARKQGF